MSQSTTVTRTQAVHRYKVNVDHVDNNTLVSMKKALPQELFARREGRFLCSVVRALATLAVSTWIWMSILPFTLSALPLWIAYAFFNGTIAFGVWILAHECGHGAMSDRKWLNDLVGYPLHTFLLVPYFSWQHSHAIHHSRTNHLIEGESHVPVQYGSEREKRWSKLRAMLGDDLFSAYNIVFSHLLGWPLYLLLGATGGPVRGVTNHFVPSENNKLFPRKWWLKVWLSTAGICLVFTIVAKMSLVYGVVPVMAVYGGPILVVNAWLILYTYLHHTDEDTPHYDEKAWNWTKGALCTIERNYPEIINWLHFDIGSSHVVHHLFPSMPHYNARKARSILQSSFSELYRVDDRPIWEALITTTKNCLNVKENPNLPGEWRYRFSTTPAN